MIEESMRLHAFEMSETQPSGERASCCAFSLTMTDHDRPENLIGQAPSGVYEVPEAARAPADEHKATLDSSLEKLEPSRTEFEISSASVSSSYPMATEAN